MEFLPSKSKCQSLHTSQCSTKLGLLGRMQLNEGEGGIWDHLTNSQKSLEERWWVYPSDTLLWPSVFEFLSFSLHNRSSNIHCADMTFSNHCTITTNYTLYLIAPSAQYHIRDLPYDLQTTSLQFPFLVSSLLPDASLRGPTGHRLLHHTIGTLPYISLHTNLVLVLLIISIWDFCSYSEKQGSFPQNSDLSLSRLIVLLRSIFAPSHLHSISYFRHSLPYCTAPNLRLALLCTPWYYIRRPFHCSWIAPFRTT